VHFGVWILLNPAAGGHLAAVDQAVHVKQADDCKVERASRVRVDVPLKPRRVRLAEVVDRVYFEVHPNLADLGFVPRLFEQPLHRRHPTKCLTGV
jgi:hypothetical protein